MTGEDGNKNENETERVTGAEGGQHSQTVDANPTNNVPSTINTDSLETDPKHTNPVILPPNPPELVNEVNKKATKKADGTPLAEHSPGHTDDSDLDDGEERKKRRDLEREQHRLKAQKGRKHSPNDSEQYSLDTQMRGLEIERMNANRNKDNTRHNKKVSVSVPESSNDESGTDSDPGESTLNMREFVTIVADQHTAARYCKEVGRCDGGKPNDTLTWLRAIERVPKDLRLIIARLTVQGPLLGMFEKYVI